MRPSEPRPSPDWAHTWVGRGRAMAPPCLPFGGPRSRATAHAALPVLVAQRCCATALPAALLRYYAPSSATAYCAPSSAARTACRGLLGAPRHNQPALPCQYTASIYSRGLSGAPRPRGAPRYWASTLLNASPPLRAAARRCAPCLWCVCETHKQATQDTQLRRIFFRNSTEAYFLQTPLAPSPARGQEPADASCVGPELLGCDERLGY